MIHPSIGRYVPILNEPDKFFACLTRPLTTTVWVNELKTQASKLEQAFSLMGWGWSEVPWYSGGYRIKVVKPGCSLPFCCGWYAVQESIAWSAVCALDPQPGDYVLDLCAAPGGKTAQIALAVGPKGAVIANEQSLSRLPSLVNTITRLGLTNVITSQVDGQAFQSTPHLFDRVLVDVPCSGEGTLRKKVGRRSLGQENWHERHSQRLRPVQKQLLNRALDLVKPGGIVVYSTCTFAPEENEAILDEVLGDRGSIEPYSIHDLRSNPGLCQWQGKTFRSDLQYAQRYWPHLNDTGGFFVARIRRTGVKTLRSMAPPPSCSGSEILSSAKKQSATVQQTDDHTALTWLSGRFDIPYATFQPYSLWQTGQEKLWIANQSCTVLAASISVPVETIGIPLVRRTSHSFKPTTASLQRFGQHVQNRFLSLNQEQCQRFMKGQEQVLKLQNIKEQTSVNADSFDESLKGFVHVRHGLYELGCGRVKTDVLYPEIPKILRAN
ncbi:MAG: RsmB/NOP family class I SAM-dependent RNA methyltransferase [Cyanobacteria bacterium P01_F01_bin.150]